MRSKYIEDVNKLAEDCVTKMIREELHTTALCVVSLPECDNMTMDYLFAQPAPAVAEYLEAISNEV
jgi:hypothetical protein